jgi:hypothetical protein
MTEKQTGKEVGMHPGLKTLLGATVVASGFLLVIPRPQPGFGDEPGRFGRLFRFGSGSASLGSGPATTPPPSTAYPESPALPASPASTPLIAPPAHGSPPRLVPQPRVSRPITEADPIVTRISLNRANDGTPFSQLLQVFADGTVIDGEGVHYVGADILKPVVDAIQAGEFSRLKGHCGGPPTDYVEQVHVIVFERTLGRLRANAFSYSGNPQGCDHTIRHLHAALDALQMKLSRPVNAASPAIPTTPAAPPDLPPDQAPNAIPLTPSP